MRVSHAGDHGERENPSGVGIDSFDTLSIVCVAYDIDLYEQRQGRGKRQGRLELSLRSGRR